MKKSKSYQTLSYSACLNIFFLINSAIKGFEKGSIIYDIDKKKWLIIDASPDGDLQIPDEFNVIATQKPRRAKDFLPIGIHQWEMTDANCNGTRELMITSVSFYI